MSCTFKKSGAVYWQIGGSMRQVLVYPGENGYWVVEVPSLPGCISQGETREKALEHIKDAIEVYIEALEADHLPVPEENGQHELVMLDI
jgi:predicted RNase H-like HicB family nuclease